MSEAAAELDVEPDASEKQAFQPRPARAGRSQGKESAKPKLPPRNAASGLKESPTAKKIAVGGAVVFLVLVLSGTDSGNSEAEGLMVLSNESDQPVRVTVWRNDSLICREILDTGFFSATENCEYDNTNAGDTHSFEVSAEWSRWEVISDKWVSEHAEIQVKIYRWGLEAAYAG